MKLLTIRRALGHRRKHPQRFVGPYKALDASGPHVHRAFAFSRGTNLVTITPRLTVRAEGWRDTTVELPDGTGLDGLSDQQYSGGKRTVAELRRGFPISLLTRASSDSVPCAPTHGLARDGSQSYETVDQTRSWPDS